MKTAFITLAIVAGMVALMATDASAWSCRAESRTGSWGVGWHTHSREYARQRALLECAARTPRRATCYITYCR